MIIMTQVNLNELTKQEQCLLRELAERSKHALYYKRQKRSCNRIRR